MRAPDLAGEGTAAWNFQSAPLNPDNDACVAGWLVTGPFHAFWDRWMIGVLHLREIPGYTAPLKKHFETATHEFFILSLEPGKPFDIEDPREIPYMRPPDAVVQFEAPDDDVARQVAELAVRCIVEKKASPDSDYKKFWEATIPKTVMRIVTKQPVEPVYICPGNETKH